MTLFKYDNLQYFFNKIKNVTAKFQNLVKAIVMLCIPNPYLKDPSYSVEFSFDSPRNQPVLSPNLRNHVVRSPNILKLENTF